MYFIIYIYIYISKESSKMPLIAFNQVISNLRAFPLTRSVAMHHAIIYLQNGWNVCVTM